MEVEATATALNVAGRNKRQRASQQGKVSTALSVSWSQQLQLHILCSPASGSAGSLGDLHQRHCFITPNNQLAKRKTMMSPSWTTYSLPAGHSTHSGWPTRGAARGKQAWRVLRLTPTGPGSLLPSPHLVTAAPHLPPHPLPKRLPRGVPGGSTHEPAPPSSRSSPFSFAAAKPPAAT